jgi:hypothetical protein
VVTARRLRTELGFTCDHSSATAFAELVAGDDQRRR